MGERLLSGATSLLLALTYGIPTGLSDSTQLLRAYSDGEEGQSGETEPAPLPTPKYGKDYTIENLLTDYNLVAFNDLTSNNHIVGCLLAGNEANVINFGDAARSDSYAKTFTMEGGNYNKNSFLHGIYEGDKGDFKVYYENSNTPRADFIQIGEPFFDAAAAKAEVQTWSTNQSALSDSWFVSKEDMTEKTVYYVGVETTGYRLEIPVDTANKNIVIPYDLL